MVRTAALIVSLWSASASAANPSPFDISANYGELARTHCRREWPDDFQMQEYCLSRQYVGMRQFKQASEKIGRPLDRALEKCVEQWTRARVPDFEMIGYCATHQAEGYRNMANDPASAPRR